MHIRTFGAVVFGLICSVFAQPVSSLETKAKSPHEQRFIECQSTPIAGIEEWIAFKQPPTKAGEFKLEYKSRAETLAMPQDTAAIEAFSWNAVPSQMEMQRLVWSKAGLTMPESSVRVLSMTTGGHSTSIAESRLVYLTSEGSWHFAGIRIVNFGSDEHEWLTYQTGQLDEEDVRVLIALINDPCLAAQPDRSGLSESISTDNYEWTLEIEGAALDRPLKRKHRGFGRTALIYSMLNQWWN